MEPVREPDLKCENGVYGTIPKVSLCDYLKIGHHRQSSDQSYYLRVTHPEIRRVDLIFIRDESLVVKHDTKEETLSVSLRSFQSRYDPEFVTSLNPYPFI